MGGLWQLVWIYTKAFDSAALSFAFPSFQDLPFLCNLSLCSFWLAFLFSVLASLLLSVLDILCQFFNYTLLSVVSSDLSVSTVPCSPITCVGCD